MLLLVILLLGFSLPQGSLDEPLFGETDSLDISPSYSLGASDNFTRDEINAKIFHGSLSCSYLTGATSDLCTLIDSGFDSFWHENYTAYNDSWSLMTNASYLTILNWSLNYTANNALWLLDTDTQTNASYYTVARWNANYTINNDLWLADVDTQTNTTYRTIFNNTFEDNINLSDSFNLTHTKCVVFISGGSICSS